MKQRPLRAGMCALFVLATAASASAAPSIVLGPAQKATTGANDVERARNDLSSRSPMLGNLSFAVRGEHALPGGNRIVRFRQQHAGLPVLGRGAAVMLDKSGKPTQFATASVETRFVGSSTPSLSRQSAATRANHVVRGKRYAPARAQLAWLPTLDGAHLGWVFYEGAMRGTPFAPVVVVDAANGDVLLREDATRFDRAASVYELNPITTPTLSSVTLEALTTGAPNLENEQIKALNCIDEGTTTGGDFDIHFCELKPTATADANGDFPYPYLGDAALEDQFAEVTMFYHTSKAYSFLTALGMPELELKPLLTIANLRFPKGWDDFDFGLMQDPSIPLEPYNNAFYTPEDPLGGVLFGEEGGGLWFGQGTQADFAYDGDVVYHEFGHAMVDRTVNLSQRWHLDSQGGSPSPGAMNEGLADYFSSSLAGDSEVGEYAAKNIFAGFSGSIRNLENDDKCPTNIAGEVHVDSTFFSGALWKVRQSLPEDQRDEYDAALLSGLIAAPTGNLGYEEMAALFTAALSASTLGQPAADALAAEFVTRGALPECKRVLEYTGPISGPSPIFGNAFYAPGSWMGNVGQSASYAPGLFQAHRSIDPEMEKLTVSIINVPHKIQGFGRNSDPYEPAVLIHFSDEPMSFTYDNDVVSTAGEPIPLQGSGYTTVDVPKGATDVYVMVVNLGDEDGLYTSLTLSLKGPPPSVGGAGGTSGFGGSGGAPAGGSGGSAAEIDPDGLTPTGGCACEVRAEQSGAGAWLLGLVALAFLGRRRRSA